MASCLPLEAKDFEVFSLDSGELQRTQKFFEVLLVPLFRLTKFTVYWKNFQVFKVNFKDLKVS